MERGKVLIINMYNEGSWQQGLKQAITAMRQRIYKSHNASYTRHTIWLGNFNLHHLMWDEGRNAHLFTRESLERSQILIDTLTEFKFQMALLKDVLMLCTLMSGNYTRPDNVFTSTLLTDAVVHCKNLPAEHLARSDHIPVTTHIIIGFTAQTEPLQLSFNATESRVQEGNIDETRGPGDPG